MRAVLGIDAAWTPDAPSGVALCVENAAGWRCAAIAPSYADFIELADGAPFVWDRPRISGGLPDPQRLIAAARTIAPDATVEVVAVDMPLSRTPITSRRLADDEVSRMFGKRKCGTHSPSRTRPGLTSVLLRDGFQALGFPLRTEVPAHAPALLEVYPHPALLCLIGAPERLTYKVSRSCAYWPALAPEARQNQLRGVWKRILAALQQQLAIDLPLPRRFDSLAAMKRYEDALDAVICAWVGIRYLGGDVDRYGDSDAAIWVPH